VTGRTLAALLLAAACLASGCGGGSNGASAKQTATSRPQARPGPFENPAVNQMSVVPAGAAQLPAAGSTAVHDPGQLHAAFASAESMWHDEFASAALTYQHAKLAFFHTTVRTQCGEQSRETGPFYCPPSHGVYLNTHFFDALARQHGLSSGFAAGYITAHEVAHHVQQLLGVHGRVAAANQSDPSGANARSVQVELQADCYAGIWLHMVSRRGELSQADVQDILTAATVVGDDFQRNQAGAELAPETWTHGSSAQRVHWVSVGLERGDPAACDTFEAG
jgi:predicted metalloprotease